MHVPTPWASMEERTVTSSFRRSMHLVQWEADSWDQCHPYASGTMPSIHSIHFWLVVLTIWKDYPIYFIIIYIYILWKINNVPNHQSILWIVRGSLILNPQPFHAISMNDATAATATLPPFFTMSQWWNPRWQCAPTSVQWCPRTSLRRERCPSDHRRTTEKWGWKKQCLSERIEIIFFRSFSQVSFYAKKSHPKQYWRSLLFNTGWAPGLLGRSLTLQNLSVGW